MYKNMLNHKHMYVYLSVIITIYTVQDLKKGTNLIWKFADQKVNVFGPAHKEKSHFKGVFGCIF